MPVALWSFATNVCFHPRVHFQNFFKPIMVQAAIRRGGFPTQLRVLSLSWPHVVHTTPAAATAIAQVGGGKAISWTAALTATAFGVKVNFIQNHVLGLCHMFKPLGPKIVKNPSSTKTWFKWSFVSDNALQASTITMDGSESVTEKILLHAQWDLVKLTDWLFPSGSVSALIFGLHGFNRLVSWWWITTHLIMNGINLVLEEQHLHVISHGVINKEWIWYVLYRQLTWANKADFIHGGNPNGSWNLC